MGVEGGVRGVRVPLMVRAQVRRIGGGRQGPKSIPGVGLADAADLSHGSWPPPRSGHACTVAGGLMYLMGGRYAGGRRNDLYVYDP